MTFREYVAAKVYVLLMARQGPDQESYPELACEYADDIAKAACKLWGHTPDGHGKCARCGGRAHVSRRAGR